MDSEKRKKKTLNQLIEFFSFFLDPNARTVTLGTIFLGMSAAMIGIFAFLRKRSLVGDAISHAILPGIALAFIFTQSKNPFYLMIGALASGWLAILLIDYISKYSKLKPDTSIGLVLSVFFGIGILLLTVIQHSGAGNQAGLDQFLFGKAASMTLNDLKIYALTALILLLVVFFCFKEFKVLSFNPDFAQVIGLPVKLLQFLLSTITVLAIAIGIQSAGVVLMVALLISPSVTARYWTENLLIMMIIAGISGALSGLTGSYISFIAPNMPTGPWIVTCLSFLALFSLFFAPKKGLIIRLYHRRKTRVRIISENLLKTIYHINIAKGNMQAKNDRKDILGKRAFTSKGFRQSVAILKRSLLLLGNDSMGYTLTSKGIKEAQRIIRLHRLWEMYLAQRMHLRADHIHSNAETIEHVITPEIEQQLLHELDYPEKDPLRQP